jgi:hypothetical protein
MHLESQYPRPSPCRVSRHCSDSTDLSVCLSAYHRGRPRQTVISQCFDPVARTRRQQSIEVGVTQSRLISHPSLLACCSYGARIGLVQDAATSQQNLTRLLKALKTHLKPKMPMASSSNINAKSSTSTASSSALANLVSGTTTTSDSSGAKLSTFTSMNTIERVYVVIHRLHLDIRRLSRVRLVCDQCSSSDGL